MSKHCRAALVLGLTLAAACTSGPRPEMVLASGQGGPFGLTSDSTSLYWTNTTGGQVMRIPKEGGTPVTLASGQLEPHAIVSSGPHLFWANRGNQTIMYMKLPPSGVEPVEVASGQPDLEGLTFDGDFVFWASGSSVVKKASLSDGVVSAVTDVPSGPKDLAISGGTHVYWSNADGSIRRASLEGGREEIVAKAGQNATSLALNSTHVYWTTFFGAIHRAPRDGGPVETLAEGEDHPRSIAVVDPFIYWAAGGEKDGAIRRMRHLGPGKPETFAAEQGEPAGIVTDLEHLYWVNQASGTVVRAPF